MNQKALNEELGEKADKLMVKQLTAEMSSSWNFKGKTSKFPFLLILGGFQGSGKTTVLNILQKSNNLIIISPDRIRHELFTRKIKFSEKFVHTVNAIRNNLLKIAISSRRNIAIDQSVNPVRINILEQIAERDRNYRVIKIFLLANAKTLIQRVRDRVGLPRVYKGTVDELKASVKKYGDPDITQYDSILDTQKLNPLETAREIEKLVTSPS